MLDGVIENMIKAKWWEKLKVGAGRRETTKHGINQAKSGRRVHG